MTYEPSLTATGLTVLRTAEVRANIVDALRSSSHFGPEAQTEPDKVLGQLIDPIAQQIGLVYELVQALYDSWDVDVAEGVYLDNLCSLVGITRQPATYSTVTLTLSGSAGTVVAAGSRARVPGGAVFATDGDATIGSGGSVDVSATATEPGPAEASAGSVTEIVDAVSGWTGVVNAADASVGSDTETDTALRTRRAQTIAALGSATSYACKAALERIASVITAVVLDNPGDVTDAHGLPPHSRQVVIYPASGHSAAELAQTIWQHKPAGIADYGTESAVVTDSSGVSQTVRWSYATTVTVTVTMTLSTTSAYPATGDTLARDAVVAYINDLTVGQDVTVAGVESAVYAAVPGISAMSTQLSDDGGTTWSTDSVAIDVRSVARTSDAQVTVTS